MQTKTINKIDTNQKLLEVQINDLKLKLLNNNKYKKNAFGALGRWHKAILELSNEYDYLKNKLDNYKNELDNYES